MSGIEDLMRKTENGEWVDQLNKADIDEREVLSEAEGIRFFTQPGDPDKIKVVLESSITPTEEELAGVRATLQLIARFSQDVKDKSQAIVFSSDIPMEMKTDVVQALLNFVPQMTWVTVFLELVAKEKELSGVMDASLLRALRLLRGTEAPLPDADVEKNLADC
jgi:hypothetical protein